MSEHVLEREQVVPGPVDDVFAFFAQVRNLERITPQWLRFEVLTPEPIAMRAGTLIEYRLRVRGVPLRWVSRIEEPPRPCRLSTDGERIHACSAATRPASRLDADVDHLIANAATRVALELAGNGGSDRAA